MKRLRKLLLFAFLLVCVASIWYAQRTDVRVSRPEEISADSEGFSPGLDDRSQTVQLTVLNGSGNAGLARRFSRQLAPLGCVVVSVADAPHDSFASSLLINRRLSQEQAQRLAARLGGVAVLPEWDRRGQEDAVLVLGRDHRRLLDRMQASR